MSYFPTDIPFMSEEELIENRLKKPYKKPEIIKGTDLVPVVRCKDCKHSEHWYRDKRRCFLWAEDGIDVFDDGFCSYGERKE